MVKAKRRRDGMHENTGNITEPPTQGCMECKAQRAYIVEHFTNGNTGWRCTVCGKILRLISGKSPSGPEERERRR
jgi:hypothetical protein